MLPPLSIGGATVSSRAEENGVTHLPVVASPAYSRAVGHWTVRKGGQRRSGGVAYKKKKKRPSSASALTRQMPHEAQIGKLWVLFICGSPTM